LVYITITNCQKCKTNKTPKTNEPTESYSTQVEGPFTHLGMDIIGPLTTTSQGNQYIIVTVDYFSRWVEAQPLKTITSQDVVKFLIDVFSRHGAPEVITSDNGVQFTSDFTKIILDLYDVYIRFTTTYHPESNGLTENRNREIGKYLRLLGNNHQDWDEVLPLALWVLRTTTNSVTKHSSFELLYGRQDHQPVDLLFKNNVVPGKSKEEILMEKFVNHYYWVREACQNVKNANSYWETRRSERNSMNDAKNLKIGDLVYIRNFSRTKLEPYLVGPFKIIKLQFNTATLTDPNTDELLKRNVHFKNLVK